VTNLIIRQSSVVKVDHVAITALLAACVRRVTATFGGPFMERYAGRSPSMSLWTASRGLARPARDFGVRGYSTFVIPAWMGSFSEMREMAAIIAQQPGVRMPLYVLRRLSPDRQRPE
jgi:hypothetical protein